MATKPRSKPATRSKPSVAETAALIDVATAGGADDALQSGGPRNARSEDDEPTALDQPLTEPMFRDDRIRLAAYRLHLSRGSASDPLTDWLEAEAEVDSEDAATS
jgi:hypothetical protein